MKNVLCIILTPCKKVLCIKSFDPETNKYIWSLPNQKLHSDVTLPKQSGIQGCKRLFEMFSFGLFKKEFTITKFTKHLLPSKSLAYSYHCTDEFIKIPSIFESIQKNLLKLDIKKIEFYAIQEFLHIRSTALFHHESIEAIRFFNDYAKGLVSSNEDHTGTFSGANGFVFSHVEKGDDVSLSIEEDAVVKSKLDISL